MGARQAKLKKSSPTDTPSQISVVSNTSTTGRREAAKMEREAAAPATRSNVTMPKPERLKKPSTSSTSMTSTATASTTATQEKSNTKPTSAEKMAKFGVKVLPFNITSELNQRSSSAEAKSVSEASQNEQNKKLEEEKPVVEEAEDVPDRMEQMVGKMGQVVSEMKSKVEEKHIPTEMPEEMRLAAQAAVSHRKSLKEPSPLQLDDKMVVNKINESQDEMDKKKRRAPPPPIATAFRDMQQQFEENMSMADEALDKVKDSVKEVVIHAMHNGSGDLEAHDEESGTTIELGSSHITIHQAGKEEEVGHGKGRERKAASLGDLSRFDSEQPMSIPLERAVSLDMVDANEESNTGTAKKRKAPAVSIVATSETAMTDTSVEEVDI